MKTDEEIKNMPEEWHKQREEIIKMFEGEGFEVTKIEEKAEK